MFRCQPQFQKMKHPTVQHLTQHTSAHYFSALGCPRCPQLRRSLGHISSPAAFSSRWSPSTKLRLTVDVASPSAEAPTVEFRELYEGCEKGSAGEVAVAHGHTLYYEVHGNPQGPAAVFLHGGPGAGCVAKHACFFDPTFWKIVLFDQRGCGKSKPTGSLAGNTTQGLVDDLEALRESLSIESWVILGGSWGVTLGLAYSIAHPDRVSGLILRGICMMRQKEIDWMYRAGASVLFPEAWHSFLSILDEDERADPLLAYSYRLTSKDLTVQEEAAYHWSRWDMSVMFSGHVRDRVKVHRNETRLLSRETEESASTSATKESDVSTKTKGATGQKNGKKGHWGSPGVQPLLECHYSVNGAFLKEPLYSSIDRIRHIPCIGVHGRRDFVCPVGTAFDLASAWPEMELYIIPEAGHSMYHPGIRHELLEATDRMKSLASTNAVAIHSQQRYNIN